MDHVSVDGLTIAYERVGRGEPLLLLHGYLGDGRSTWRHQLEGLSRDFTVVAWDAPGAGESDDPPAGFGISGYASCLAAFIAELGLGAAHVMGLSFGGALALAFHHAHGGLVKTLVLASAYAGWRGSLGTEAAEARLAQAYQLSEGSGADLVEALLPTMFAMPVPPEDLEAFRLGMQRFHPAGFRAMAAASAEDLRHTLPAVDVPTLLIYGDRDQRAPLTVAESVQAAVTGSKLVVLEGAGHVCNVEMPEQFNSAVLTFLVEPRAW